MSAADIAVVAADAIVAAGLGWWFFGPKPAAEAAETGGVQEIRVRVRGGYAPSRIHARPGLPVRLIFDRQETGDCTSRVVFPGLGISADLPAFTQTAVNLPAQAPGEYGFACGMNMIHGLLTVNGKPGHAGTGPGVDAPAAEVTATPGGSAGPQAATITVDGGYHPDRVLARAGAPLGLEFDRREEGACSGHVVFPGLGVEADLAAGKRTVVDLPALAEGRYEFTCGMGMLHGEIEATGPGPRAQPPPATAPVIVPPVVPDCCAVPRPAAGEDAEAAERRAEITDLARRVAVGTVLTIPVLFGVMASDFFHPAWLPGILVSPWFGLALPRCSPTPAGRSTAPAGWAWPTAPPT